ncbi:fluoroquinolone transport system ATP-binding protein [Anaerobacterium chartisolvens]|uniref:Fluoroquinolone transport system ATP-binding protein n=1 Tax=Anaerobacterium chartisolvens TaxID=1297424 RepID=A0A369AJH7_9FIRM|nr:ABC transporter ATP-binding protein [Anaerobacterium chartisolvens]RCX08498.1 fluoroquinolone transport system ATP-binding protein [Anaerobacterium chartisolvens]
MITVNNVYHDYGGKGHYAVTDISFSVKSGKIFGFLGPSGAGKSTVQNIMTGLIPLQRGEVLYDGNSVKALKTKFFNQIGVSFEQPNVYARLTGYENLKYFAALFSVPTHDPMKLLDRVGLREAAHKKASEYSKGMRQRLTLARALINKPKYLFLDEPTSGLDPSTAASVRELIGEQRDGGAAVFLTTHNMELADSLCDTVAFLYNGKVAAMDSPEVLKRQYGKRLVTVVYDENGSEHSKSFDMNDSAALAQFLLSVNPIKIHSQEATLEEIFLSVTGKELKS